MKKIDRSNWMKWLVLILASFIVLPINAHHKCPDGEYAEYEQSHEYRDDAMCSDSLDLYSYYDKNAYLCCEMSSAYQCKQTGMVSRFLVGGSSRYPVLSVNRVTRFPKFVYYSERDGNRIVCPYPIGYLWYNQFLTSTDQLPEDVLPTDYKDTNSILKPCNKNGDCAVDAFCGDVINHSFNGKYSRLESDPNQFCTYYSHDRRNCELQPSYQPFVDEHKHFCYKIPEDVGATTDNAQILIESNEINLKLCDSDNACGKGRKCDLSNTPKWCAYNPNTDKREEYKGICIESVPVSYTFFKVYDALPSVNRQIGVGKKYLPVNSERKRQSELEPCNKNWDCLDQEFCGYVYSLNDVASMDSINKYCYKVPEDLPNAFVKPDGVDLLVCNGDQDCDGGTCDTAASRNYLSNVNSQQKVFTGICLKLSVEEEEENSSLIIILVVILVALIVVVFATLIGGFVLFKLKKKPTNCATETTGDGKKNKKAKKEKKNKKGKKASGKTSTTTKSISMTGKSGMGTTTGGYSPAIF